MRKVPHGWTKEKMERCAETFMEQIENAYFNYSNKVAMKEISKLIEQYSRIRISVARGENFIEVKK